MDGHWTQSVSQHGSLTATFPRHATSLCLPWPPGPVGQQNPLCFGTHQQVLLPTPQSWEHPLTSAVVVQVLSPTYKQRNEDFRKLFKQLPDSERLIVGEQVTGGGREGTGMKSGSSGTSHRLLLSRDSQVRANSSGKVSGSRERAVQSTGPGLALGRTRRGRCLRESQPGESLPPSPPLMDRR